MRNDWPYSLFSREAYETALLKAGVSERDNVRSACEKLLSVVVGKHDAATEIRGPNRKYIRTDTVTYRYGIPYELIEKFLSDNFPHLSTSYHSLRWYMVRMREMAGQTTSQKGMAKERLEALRIQGVGELPDRRERARKERAKKEAA